jgi:hypothetical protein
MLPLGLVVLLHKCDQGNYYLLSQIISRENQWSLYIPNYFWFVKEKLGCFQEVINGEPEPFFPCSPVSIEPVLVWTQNGWWQACHALGLPGYDPYSLEGVNANLLYQTDEIDPISGSLPIKGYPGNVRKV